MNDPRLENYLSTLDRALVPMPVSERAEIVTEIKSHVLAALERNPDQSVDTVLAALGEAEVVANRYLLERGLAPGKPPISPVVKWIVIGFLGTMALVLAAVAALALFLTPLVKVDDNKQSVSLFGGMVEVEGDDVHFHGQPGNYTFSGSANAPGKGKTVAIKLNNGELELKTSRDEFLSWDCRGTRNGEQAKNPDDKGELLDFTAFGSVKCDLHVPEGATVVLTGANGKIELERPRFHANVELANGKLEIEPAAGVRYGYELSVTNGRAASLVSDPNPEFKIRAHITNGRISQ